MNLQAEALLMLEHRGAILETARAVSDLLHQHQIRGAIIGGIAVVLNGHLRTTRDVDVWVADRLDAFADILRDAGATYEPVKREFLLNGIAIHLVPDDLAQPEPRQLLDIDGITTIALADLINMKIRSGLRNLSRAQDIADVVGLIRQQHLSKEFAAKIDKKYRADFRKLVDAALPKEPKS
jgi:hypothetical protein